MPQVIVRAEPAEGHDGTVTLKEWVLAEHFADEHASAQFLERLGWAVLDATKAEEQSRD